MRRRPGLVLTAAAVLLAGCSAATAPGPAATTAMDEPSPRPVLLDLTGREAADGYRPRPVYVVKVDNTLAGRPQQGVGAADLVIEEPVEGGLTRLAAFYQSTYPDQVGPVRSVRASDVGLVQPADATVIASGGSPEGLAAYQKAGIDLVTEGAAGISRDSMRAAPYNLFADVTRVARSGDGTPPQRPYFDFGTTKLSPGAAANTVTVTFSESRSERWSWRSGGVWESTDSPLRPTTLITLTVRMIDTGQRDAAGSVIPEVVTTGNGSGYLFRDGEVIEILWRKTSPRARWEFTTPAGLVVQVPPGRTWVSLLPKDTGSVQFS